MIGLYVFDVPNLDDLRALTQDLRSLAPALASKTAVELLVPPDVFAKNDVHQKVKTALASFRNVYWLDRSTLRNRHLDPVTTATA